MNKLAYRFMLGGSVCAIVAVSFLSHPYKQRLHTKGLLHNPAHSLGFAILTTLAWKSTDSRRFLVPVSIAFLALCIEAAQHWLYEAPIEWFDIAVDLAGVSGGTLASVIFQSRSKH